MLEATDPTSANHAPLAAGGKRRRSRLRRACWVLVPALTCAAYFGFYRYHLKRFDVVSPGVFYRVGQPTEWGFHVLDKVHGARTVVSLQLFDFRLKRGPLDPGRSDGRKEAEFVESLGMRHVQWTMGDEQCWPWPEPWQIEEFYDLVDDPANHPIVVHCMGGRHRTGTIAALYRMEYDRWSAADALKEMYSYPFGEAVPTQEHNLLAYVPRPEPDAATWSTLKKAFGPHFTGAPLTDYRTLVRGLRAAASRPEVRQRLLRYVQDREPFALPLADRLIDGPDHPLAGAATESARVILAAASAAPEVATDEASLVAAVALVADYGKPHEQELLAELVRREARQSTAATAVYEAIVRGLTNRYTRNRIAFLQPLVDDLRPRAAEQTARYRYCDTAMYFIATVTDEIPCRNWPHSTARENAQQAARRWYAEHSDALRLAGRTPPPKGYGVLAGDGPLEEDLSGMRR